MTITHDALDLTIQGPCLYKALHPLYRAVAHSVQGSGPLCTGSTPLLVTSGGQDLRPVQTCLLEDPLPPGC